MKPATHLRLGLRRALARRYGYSGLATFRVALRRAVARLEANGESPVDSAPDVLSIAGLYCRGLVRLRKKWPQLNTSVDPLDPGELALLRALARIPVDDLFRRRRRR